ncbi:MAG: helix-turn-helix transcriptional regulator [Pseudomonadota bacterium]
MKWIEALAQATSVDDVMAVIRAETGQYGGLSVGYSYERASVHHRHAKKSDSWARIYWEDWSDKDPSRRMPTPESAVFSYAQGYPGFEQDGQANALYEEVRRFGFTGTVFVQDMTAQGLRQRAALNIRTDVSERRFDSWRNTEGAVISLIGQTALTRMRALWQADRTGSDLLTDRERQVLEQLARGHRTARIAEHIGISTKTVDFHLTNVRAKLKARTRDEALVQAIKLGLIEI